MKLLDDQIVVKKIEEENKIGSIIVPHREDLKVYRGTLVNAGVKCHTLKNGMIVYFSHIVGQRFTHEGEDFLLMREKEIIGYEDDNL